LSRGRQCSGATKSRRAALVAGHNNIDVVAGVALKQRPSDAQLDSMSLTMTSEDRLTNERFPRSSAYNLEWVLAGTSGGANSLWLTEWLSEAMQLRPGQRVLDLGCGRGASSIFLHREFGVQVWATDLWFDATERLSRIRDAAVGDAVFPIHADAHALPFASGFFDAIVSIDSFVYYGTDDLYANYLARFLTPGGQIGIAGAGLANEIDGSVPEHLQSWWEPSMACLHSARWWRQHWQRSGVLEVEMADTMPDGWKLWLDWQHATCPNNQTGSTRSPPITDGTSATSVPSPAAELTSSSTNPSPRYPSRTQPDPCSATRRHDSRTTRPATAPNRNGGTGGPHDGSCSGSGPCQGVFVSGLLRDGGCVRGSPAGVDAGGTRLWIGWRVGRCCVRGRPGLLRCSARVGSGSAT
jgi:SAM-dependent methyltransferase